MFALLRKSMLKSNFSSFTRKYNTQQIIYDNFNTILIGARNTAFLALIKINSFKQEQLENEIILIKREINLLNKK